MKLAEESTLSRIKDLVQNATICMVTNNIHDWPLQVNDLHNQYIDDLGNIWFFIVDTGDESQSLRTGGSMEVFYSNVKASEFLSLTGEAAIADETELEMKNLPFSQMGRIETSYRIIRFIADEAFYWDDQENDMISLAG